MREIEALQARLRDMSVEVAELARKIGQRQREDTDPSMRSIGPGQSRSEKTYEIRED
jgi:hypothetical protein